MNQLVHKKEKSSYFVEADLFFLSCNFLNLSIAFSLLTKTPKANPVRKAPVVRAPVKKADLIAKLIIFIYPHLQYLN